MIQEFEQDSYNFDLLVDSGFKNIESIRTATVLVRKPDLTTFSKNLTDDDFYPKTNKIRIPVLSGNINLEGIYDYQLTDTTVGSSTINHLGKLLQFSVRKKLS